MHALLPPDDPSQAMPRVTSDLPESGDSRKLSSASLSFSGGGSVTLWSDEDASLAGETLADTSLLLHPERPVVIGRQQGGEVPYLDPHYVPKHIVPGIGTSVLTQLGDGKDAFVSRGHFMLRAVCEGIVLLNGVPRREGGVRSPLNGTWLLKPEHRRMHDGEEYLIKKGQSATISLPNNCQVLIRAE